MSSLIRVHKVESGEAKTGCDPNGVQILFKEATTMKGNPNFSYLRDLLQNNGFLVNAGDQIANTPLFFLCVTKAGGGANRDAILSLLESDQYIDTENVYKEEGNKGDS